LAKIHLGDVACGEMYAKMEGLLFHFGGKPRATGGKHAGVVDHFRRNFYLPAHVGFFQHQRF
jgi:hypothetical protein